MRDVPLTVPESYLDALFAGDEAQARKHARILLDEGMAPGDVLVHLVAAGQIEAGRRWSRNEWSVGDEHVATSVSDAVRAGIMAEATWVDNHQLVLVACAEGETHGFPARLLADALRLGGYRMVFVGPALSSADLRSIIHDRDPDLIALSCTNPRNFVGLTRSVAAVSDSTAPLAIGGAAIRDERTARWFGATIWAPSGPALVEQLSRGARPARTAIGSTRMWATEPFIVDSRLADLTMVALQALLQRSPNRAGYDGWSIARTSEYLADLIRVAGAAVLVDDPAVFQDYAQACAEMLLARAEPLIVLDHCLEQLAVQCDRDLPLTAAVLQAGRDHLTKATLGRR